MTLTAQERKRLHQTARDSISYGLRHQRPMPVSLDNLPESLQVERCCFVTLKLAGELRGCIGTTSTGRPLIEEVSENAYAAAFRDRRFGQLTAKEFDNIKISLSILSDATPITVASTLELASILRPGIDGVILENDSCRGVFLPQVWENLPDPVDFIRQLKCKAGLPKNIEPPGLRVFLFEVESV